MVSVFGYPQQVNYCPECGSNDVETNDNWQGTGKVKCNKCGCKCIVIEDE